MWNTIEAYLDDQPAASTPIEILSDRTGLPVESLREMLGTDDDIRVVASPLFRAEVGDDYEWWGVDEDDDGDFRREYDRNGNRYDGEIDVETAIREYDLPPEMDDSLTLFEDFHGHTLAEYRMDDAYDAPEEDDVRPGYFAVRDEA